MNSKTAIVIGKLIEKIQLIAGIAILIIFGVCTVMLPFMPENRTVGFVIFCIIADILGILLIMLSRKRKKLISTFKNYVNIISGNTSGSIANLAEVTGTSQDIVMNNLELMIKKGYFANAYIDRETNCIVLKANNSSKKETNESMQSEYVTVTCKCCGGINKIEKGKVGECDFCGSPLNQ